MMPRQRPHRSKQDYGTPPEFIQAACRYLEIPAFSADLAASPENAVCPLFFCGEDNALTQSWDLRMGGWLWLNPPYTNIRPWVQKSFLSSRADGIQIAALTPASVGSNWWADWVDQKATVLFLKGRLTFVGCQDPYPKDCALLLYSTRLPPRYAVWDWAKFDTQTKLR